MRLVKTLFPVLVGLAAAGVPASAQPVGNCMPAEAWRAELGSPAWAEDPFAEAQAGKPGGGARMELWVNAKTRSWTLLVLPRPGVARGAFGGREFKPAGPAPKPRKGA